MGPPRNLVEAVAIGIAASVFCIVAGAALAAATGWGSVSADWGLIPVLVAIAVADYYRGKR